MRRSAKTRLAVTVSATPSHPLYSSNTRRLLLASAFILRPNCDKCISTIASTSSADPFSCGSPTGTEPYHSTADPRDLHHLATIIARDTRQITAQA